LFLKQRFYLYRRGDTFYWRDSRTGKQQSLETKGRNTALRRLELKRQTAADPAYNQFILKACLATQDPLLAKRTWATVMAQMQTHGKETTKTRCVRAMKSKAFDRLRHVTLIETTAEDFLAILNGARPRTALTLTNFVRCLHPTWFLDRCPGVIRPLPSQRRPIGAPSDPRLRAQKISVKRPLMVVSRIQQFSGATRTRPRQRAWPSGHHTPSCLRD